jgi:hypothetical protein
MIDPMGLRKIDWCASLNDLQTIIDLLGLIPVIGEPFDLINAGIHLARGQYGYAALSAAAMVPIGGWLATGGKFALRYGDDVFEIEAKIIAKSGDNVAKTGTNAVVEFWPKNGGALGKWEREFLMPGTEIDRFGSGFGRYFSPRGTPLEMRALPPGNTGAYNAFKVMKPFEVQSSIVSPAFNQLGLGKQYVSPVNMDTLIKRGIIVPIWMF